MPPKYRSNPTPWPNPAYYFLRFVQFFVSIGIMGILSYFIYYLVKNRISVPPEFIILYVAAVLSLFTVVTTTVAKCCGALNAKFALGFDGIVLICVSVAFALLTRAMHGLVFSSCTDGHWGAEGGNGVFVCRLYKAVWACALTSVLTFIGSGILDIVVIRRVGSHKYTQANPKSMQQTKTYAPNYSQDTSYGSGGLPSHG
ncbi:hypothetical protein DRE_04359 [Drechslerella stenobrocha 248]|uniref:MARVEL domain-containing protein n=1 Tax=Drechslerella stenobrocha 248 TaxID=1043628 RepID=W7HQH4_9PEZI|nr:hypothetical protein DRE_04359 [Drechslerella stenobrocha 248]